MSRIRFKQNMLIRGKSVSQKNCYYPKCFRKFSRQEAVAMSSEKIRGGNKMFRQKHYHPNAVFWQRIGEPIAKWFGYPSYNNGWSHFKNYSLTPRCNLKEINILRLQ